MSDSNSDAEVVAFLPYEVKESSAFGRYLVASRDLHPRELIISEEPVMEGPTDDSDYDSIPQCLSCSIKMTENQYRRCSKCHFPCCSTACEQNPIHVTNECSTFQRNHVSFPPPQVKHILNKSIIILRCLLLRENKEKVASGAVKWNKIMSMSDNGEYRRNRPNCITADERVLQNLRAFLASNIGKDDVVGGQKSHFQYHHDTFPHLGLEEEAVMLKLSGILDVNAHSFPVKVGGTVVASKCHLYAKTSLICHSCSPNCSWAPEKTEDSSTYSNKLVIRTNVFVPKGEILSVAYDDKDLLHGTLRRLTQMEISGMFICKCARCLDPTEFGSFLSGLKCQECGPGYLLSSNPTNSFAPWVCSSCGNVEDEIYISQLIKEAEDEIGFPKCEIMSDPDTMEQVGLLKEYVNEFSQTLLHPNHYIIQEANLRIVRGLCYSLTDLTDSDLQDFLQRCKDLLAITDILTPGFGEYRAFIQYHYFRGLLMHEERIMEMEPESLDFPGTSTRVTPPPHPPEEGEDDEGSLAEKMRNSSLKQYKLILSLQTEVLIFLQEKFSPTIPKTKYVLETMGFVKEQIKLMEEG